MRLVHRARIGLAGDLSVRGHVERRPAGIEHASQQIRRQHGRCAAPDKDRADCRPAPLNARAADLLAQRGGIGLIKPFQPGVRIEIAIGAADRAEGNVEVEGVRDAHWRTWRGAIRAA